MVLAATEDTSERIEDRKSYVSMEALTTPSYREGIRGSTTLPGEDIVAAPIHIITDKQGQCASKEHPRMKYTGWITIFAQVAAATAASTKSLIRGRRAA